MTRPQSVSTGGPGRSIKMLISSEQSKICIVCGGLDTSSYYCRACEQSDWPELYPCSSSPASTEDAAVKRPQVPPFARSVLSKNSKEVETLLAQKADPLTKDRNGKPVIFQAILAGNVSMMKVFVEKAPKSVVHQNPECNGANCLHVACEHGNIKVRPIFTDNHLLRIPGLSPLSTHHALFTARWSRPSCAPSTTTRCS